MEVSNSTPGRSTEKLTAVAINTNLTNMSNVGCCDDGQNIYCTNPSTHQTLEEMDFERGIWQAALSNDFERVRSLLAKGTDPDSEDRGGYRALHYAARCGNTAICTLLLEAGADINAATRVGRASALHRAALAGQDATVALLLKSRSNALAQDCDGRTALHRAVEAESLSTVKLLVTACPCLRQVGDIYNRTPADYAQGDHNILQALNQA